MFQGGSEVALLRVLCAGLEVVQGCPWSSERPFRQRDAVPDRASRGCYIIISYDMLQYDNMII